MATTFSLPLDESRLTVQPLDDQELLAKLWLRWKHERLLETIWHEGVPPLTHFLIEFTRPEATTLGCFRVHSDGLSELEGMCWINKTFVMLGKYRKAEVGMAFVRHTPPSRVMEYVRQTISYAFKERDLDSIFGCTPEPNRAAVLLGRRAGFHQTTIEAYTSFDGKLCSAVLQWMTRPQWEAKERGNGREE